MTDLIGLWVAGRVERYLKNTGLGRIQDLLILCMYISHALGSLSWILNAEFFETIR